MAAPRHSPESLVLRLNSAEECLLSSSFYTFGSLHFRSLPFHPVGLFHYFPLRCSVKTMGNGRVNIFRRIALSALYKINVESPKPPTKAPKDPYRAREPIIEKHPQTPLEKAPLPKENEIGGVGTDSGIGGGTGGLQPNSEDNDINEVRTDDGNQESNEVYIMDTKPEERATSFFSQPGILAAVIGGAVVGLLCAILVVMFVVYRMRKKDEGSYALDEPKRSPTVNSYTKNSNREFYA
ncbi:syndecan-2 isoform X3 [Hetaerina americana]|uniref:syndecan-2 isoform X3 n=1 Tax=Hetaerina americana TaxID=62018 RepID=UPI003A7F2FBD